MPGRFKHVSIRTILISTFLLLMVFPMIVITYVTYKKENQIFRDQVSRFMLQTVQQTQHALDANLEEIDRLTWPLLYSNTMQFVGDPMDTSYQVVQETQRFRNHVYLDLFRGRMNHIRSIYFINTHHAILTTESPFESFERVNQDNYAYITSQLKKNPLKIQWFSEELAVIPTRSGFASSVQTSVLASRILLDRNNAEPLGTLFIQFNDRFIHDVLKNVRIGRTGSLILLGPSSETIYQQQSELPANPLIKKALHHLSSEQSGTTTVADKWLLTYDTSRVSGWKMVAVVPLDELTAPNQAILRTLLLIAGIGSIVSIFVSIALATSISRPVVRLSRLMSLAADGNLDVRDHSESFKEIIVLQKSFNTLMERTKRLIQENEREQKEKREAVLRALQTQIHPHFLYNTLDTIYWMAKNFKADAISQLVSALGRFFRLSLNAGQEWTTVEREFEHVRNYLQIQSIRFRDKITYELTFDDAIRNNAILPLILQPLVENSLEHGILHSDAAGKVLVSGWREGNTVMIEVYDSGKGMDAEKLLRVQQDLYQSVQSEHVGLRNVQQRIKMAFGPEYGITIESVFSQYTRVVIRVPVQKNTHIFRQQKEENV